MKIGVDMHGGDRAPESTIEGVVLATKERPDLKIKLLGNKSELLDKLKSMEIDPSELDIIDCPEKVEMHDHPTRVLAQKPKSSIAVGFKMLKAGEIDALASAGNTGAMLVGSLYTVNSIPGIIRPCITSMLPKEDGTDGLILDVGANADCKPDVLYQFAILGSLYAEFVMGVDKPRVGLLNIGEEPEKGNLLAQAAHELMADTNEFNFVGNVEGRDLFGSDCDVVVCDGFTGNVVLKEAEAFYYMIKKRKIEDPYFERFNYENYGGTAVLGINGNVVIGHGISNGIAIKNMILHAAEVVEADLTARIKQAIHNE